MTPEEIKSKIKDIITNHIRSAEDPSAEDACRADLHAVLTAKMREKVLGNSETSERLDDELDLNDNND